MKSQLFKLPPSKLNLTALFKYFPDEDAAREFLEAWRWPNGAICPHCKSTEAYKITPKQTETYTDKKGKKRTPRKGLWKCAKCRKGFSVTVGTIFERSLRFTACLASNIRRHGSSTIASDLLPRRNL